MKENQILSQFKIDTDYAVYKTNNPEDVKDFKTVFENDGKFTEFQRELKPKHVKEIKNAIMSDPYVSYFIPPIRVGFYGGQIIVADGNHTLNAFRAAWAEGSKAYMRIVFMDLPQTEEALRQRIIEINNTQMAWRIHDYVKSKADAGRACVVDLLDFATTHSLCQSKGKKAAPSTRYAGAFFKGYNVTNEIKNDTLIITEEDKEFGYTIYPQVQAMVDTLGWQKNNWLETFIQGWWEVSRDKAYAEILKKYGFETFISHFNELTQSWKPVCRKKEWESCFRTALYEMKDQVELRKWKKAA